MDTDGDGVGDNGDTFPSDENETIDSDGDGVGDNSDAFPSDANETMDTDGDGVGDNSNAYPDDASEQSKKNLNIDVYFDNCLLCAWPELDLYCSNETPVPRKK